MTKGFKEYLQNTKNEFVTAVWELNLSPAQRVPMENMILAFDQCRHKLEAQLQQPVVVRGGDYETPSIQQVRKDFYCKNVNTTPNTPTEPLPVEGVAQNGSDGICNCVNQFFGYVNCGYDCQRNKE